MSFVQLFLLLCTIGSSLGHSEVYPFCESPLDILSKCQKKITRYGYSRELEKCIPFRICEDSTSMNNFGSEAVCKRFCVKFKSPSF
ncbi:hypothetical protein D915_002386 [Fasciola hepatica]|uniref:BPTI/Kunitz inhibitor domain-containing protein n=1 Tax=Fasciola hepatica TaxID=6192 RepID=A0A4E0RL20_FASHE|nr:hypothetical protein D915_002386 [Fasciola hepatica]